jgi:hypothetical protein
MLPRYIGDEQRGGCVERLAGLPGGAGAGSQRPEGEEFQKYRSVDGGDGLAASAITIKRSAAAAVIFSGVCGTSAFDRPPVGCDLICSVNGHVEFASSCRFRSRCG